ncbi:MAG: MFS transporter, partial [Armatimonadaceae bacterium]
MLGISSACLTVTVPAWTSWMSDLVPSESRGRYFGHRNTLAGLATMLVPLPAGWLLDRYAGSQDRGGFPVLFGLACVFAVGAFVLILRQPEPPSTHNAQSTQLSAALLPVQDPVFRKFLAFACLLVAGQGIGGPFFLTWQLEPGALALPYLGVQILGGVASGASLLANPYWGHVTDKFGARPVLALACLVVAIAPILWVLTDPGKTWNIPFILILSITSGIGWSAIGLAQFHLLIGLSKPELRSGYVGFFSAATGVVGGVAPLVGGWLMENLEDLSAITGPIHWNNFKVVFVLSAVLRLAAPWFLKGLADSQEPASADMVRRVLDVRNVSAIRHVRRLAAPLGSDERRDAIVAIGENRSRLAL